LTTTGKLSNGGSEFEAPHHLLVHKQCKTKHVCILCGRFISARIQVCRSPLSEAIARHEIELSGLSDRVEIASRGLTDNYSAWGTAAEPRMITAARNLGLAESVVATLVSHESKLLSRHDVLDPNTVLFLVTTQHEEWTRSTVGDDAVEIAKNQGRLKMVDASGGDIVDPYFGDENLYLEVCQLLLRETPTTLTAVLKERNISS